MSTQEKPDHSTNEEKMRQFAADILLNKKTLDPAELHPEDLKAVRKLVCNTFGMQYDESQETRDLISQHPFLQFD